HGDRRSGLRHGRGRQDQEGRAGAEPRQDDEGAGRGRREMTRLGEACTVAALSWLFAADAAVAQRTTLQILIRGTNANPARPASPVNNLQELSAAFATCWSP